MKNKKILIIGDLTTAHNLGAIATTKCLKELFEKKFPDCLIRYIDHRSFIQPTPLTGWPKYKAPSNAKILSKRILSRLRMLEEMEKFYKYLHNTPVIDHVPAKVSEYDYFSKKMIDREILNYEFLLFKESDLVIINGEGNIVNGTDQNGKYRIGGRYILFLGYFIKKYMDKYCALINHTVDPDNNAAREMIKIVYPLLDYISVREPLSVEKLRSIGFKGKVDFIPDALFSYTPPDRWFPPAWLKKKIDFNKPYICIGDSSGIRTSTGHSVSWNIVEVFSDLIKKLRKISSQIIFIDGFSFGNEKINRVCRRNNLIQINIENCEYHDIYFILQKASLFMSGRWHASILALLGGTPIISWGADSHKTKAIYSLIPDYPEMFYSIHELPIFTDEIAAAAKNILNNPQKYKNLILKNLPELRKASYRNADLNI
jgi:polysaccharide pyruvyl transferase WcaK-like protein